MHSIFMQRILQKLSAHYYSCKTPRLTNLEFYYYCILHRLPLLTAYFPHFIPNIYVISFCVFSLFFLLFCWANVFSPPLSLPLFFVLSCDHCSLSFIIASCNSCLFLILFSFLLLLCLLFHHVKSHRRMNWSPFQPPHHNVCCDIIRFPFSTIFTLQLPKFHTINCLLHLLYFLHLHLCYVALLSIVFHP